jgi:rod shape-determining protein MreC
MQSTKFRIFQFSFIALVALGLVLLSVGGYLSPIGNLLLTPFIQIQTWVAERYLVVQTVLNAPEDIARLQQRVTELESENSRLKIQNIELQQSVLEAQVLATLVDYARTSSENQYTAASVIGFDASPFLRYIIINRGSDDGLRTGMPVVTNQGLVGRIAAVTSQASRVQLITDSGSYVNARLQQADEDGILQGQLNGDLVINSIPQNAKIQVGELVVTSGLGGNFPPNLVLGQVTSVIKRDFDLFQSANVQPSVDFSQLEIVLVIMNFQPIDISPLLPNE